MAHLRVISGKAKGRRLSLVPGDSTRPITDRVKESLFNIIQPDIPGCVFLDLFAGTGSVGIEALSRGAEFVRFVDNNQSAIKTVKDNLAIADFNDQAEVLQLDAFGLLARKPDMVFDYIYIAPPQYLGLWEKALLMLDKAPEWMVEDGWVIVQIDPKEYSQPIALSHYSLFEERKYGNTLLLFYEKELMQDDS